MRLRCFSGCLQPSWVQYHLLLITEKAVVSSEDEDLSLSFHLVHSVLCDVTLQFYLLEEVMTPLSSWSTSLSTHLAPCFESCFVRYQGLPFPLLSTSCPCLFISSTSLTGTVWLGLLFQIHSDSLCFLIRQFSSHMFISVIDRQGWF